MTSTELHPFRPTDNKQYGAYLCDLPILQGRPGRQGPQGAAGEKGSRVSGHSLAENLSLSNIYTSDCLQKLSSKGERDVNLIAGS